MQTFIMHNMTYILALFLFAILACLATAGFFLLRKPNAQSDAQDSARMARALAWRVGLSITLFLCLLLAWGLGLIQPTGLPMVRG